MRVVNLSAGRLAAALALLLGSGTAAFAQPQEEQIQPAGGQGGRQGQQKINVDVEDAELTDVMDQIGRQVGRNILVEPNVKETVSVSLHEIPWREAVDVIARMTRCEVEERPGGILLLTQPPKVTIQFTDANVRTVLQLLAAYSGKNIIIAPEVQGRVTLDLKEVHWLRALHAIVKTVGDYEVVEESDDLLRIVSRSSIEQQLETVVFPLSHVRPPAQYRAVPPRQLGGTGQQTAAATLFVGPAPTTTSTTNLEQTFTLFRALQQVVVRANINGATLEYDVQTNAFIITATRPLLQQIKRIIDKVDIEPPQVFAEVRFVTTRDNDFERTGFSFADGSDFQGLSFTGPFPNVAGTGRTINAFRTIPGDPAFNSPQGATPVLTAINNVGEYPFLLGEGYDQFSGAFNLPAILDLDGLNLTLNMIHRDDRSRVVQAPSLFMLDNTDAVIFVGDNVPYAELRVTPDANGNVLQTLQEGADSPVAVGFSLFLQPHVVPNSDRINITVLPRVNVLTGTTSPIAGFERFGFGQLNIDLPRTREQALVSQILLEDSQTAVLGGLRTRSQTEVIKAVPILSSIPILGNLFKGSTITNQMENLTIFISPTIVRQPKTMNSIFLRATKRLEEDDYFYQREDAPSEDEALDSLDQQSEATDRGQ